MRCPYCKSIEDRVVDSRLADDGGAIRRRRECGSCGRRYTTFERAEAAGLRVVKRSGEREPFDRAKVISGIRKACKNRPVGDPDVERIADEIEETVRQSGGAEVSSQEVGLAVLDRLRELDEVAYVRFASVYKDFQDVTDFERELGQLLPKKTPPKRAGKSRAGTGEGDQS
jgi:transcriptional repressor NrdR